MTSSTRLETTSGAPTGAGGQWIWDSLEGGIAFVSHVTAPKEFQRRSTRSAPAHGMAGCLLSSLEITFVDTIDALDQMRFKRHIQRHVEPGQPDVVTLRDIKDVVLFQVQQRLPEEFLAFFNTPSVTRFLRALILYCYCYINTWEWLTFSESVNENKIRMPGLRSVHQSQQENMCILRSLMAREYLNLIAGVGESARYHHMANGVKSWSQRDARLWEMLLRVSVRVTWLALQRRYLNIIDAEVSRLFRGAAFNTAARRMQATQQGSENGTMGGASPSRSSRRNKNTEAAELREAVLNFPVDNGATKLFAQSPAALEVMARDHSWTLLGLGVSSFPWCIRWKDPRLRLLEAAIILQEEDLGKTGLFIGILGMERGHFDTMLNLRDKERKQEMQLMTTGSTVGRTYHDLFSEHSKRLEPYDTRWLLSFPRTADSHRFSHGPPPVKRSRLLGTTFAQKESKKHSDIDVILQQLTVEPKYK